MSHHILLMAVLALVASCGTSSPPTDTGPLDTGHSYPDSGICAPDMTHQTFVCDGTSQIECQRWAEQTLPGWDVIAICYPAPCGPDCIRGESVSGFVVHDGAGADGGPDTCTSVCGNGPACGPGFMCARPIGDPTAPRACVCDHP